ncbi:MAG: hypothetical protein ABL934_03200 [Lysobacteraceae bacterium]
MGDYASIYSALSVLFDADIVGDGPQATGYAENGVPLRFANIQYGTKRADVGYAINGVDVSNLWAANGTASYINQAALPVLIRDYQQGQTGPVTSNASFAFQRNGTCTFFPSDSSTSNWKIPTAATAGDDYDIQFTQTGGNTQGTLTGTLTVWMRLDTTRGLSLQYEKNTSGSLTARRIILVQLRRRSDGVIVYAFTVTMEAESDIN